MTKTKKGFTLAEILITLTIIGVVAAINIPTLMNNINDQQNKIAWRKAFADVSQAFNRSLVDNSGTFKGVCVDGDNDCLRDKFAPYLNYVKSCNNSDTNGSNTCIYDTRTVLKYLSGSNFNTFWSASALVLNNGMILLFNAADNVCDQVFGSSNVSNCGWFIFDVNGFTGPNTVGKDIYHGWILPDKILPVGALDQMNASATYYNSSSCDTSNPSAKGWGCSALYLYQ